MKALVGELKNVAPQHVTGCRHVRDKGERPLLYMLLQPSIESEAVPVGKLLCTNCAIRIGTAIIDELDRMGENTETPR